MEHERYQLIRRSDKRIAMSSNRLNQLAGEVAALAWSGELALWYIWDSLRQKEIPFAYFGH